MKIVIAPDSFKNCMSAAEAAEAIREGLAQALSHAEFDLIPMADGGEDTVRALVDATGGTLHAVEAADPLARPIQATYGILGDGETAVIEMAAASGIHLVDDAAKNPLEATTYGTGQLMRAALDAGAKRLILGIGGSATNDGGVGMAEALGARFLDENGRPIARGGGHLDWLRTIDRSGIDPRLADTAILIASDVTNPLTGPDGASAVVGPQKGADPDMVRRLDANLAHYVAVIADQIGRDVVRMPGAGAGLLAFTDAVMDSGVRIVARTVRLAEHARDADYCITGEGGIDFQTGYGKTPMGVAQAVHEGNPGIHVIALAGCVGEGVETLYELGVDAVFGIVPAAMPLERAIAQGRANLVRTARNVGRVVAMCAEVML